MPSRSGALPQLVSVALGALAAIHAAAVRQLLPALFGSLPSFLLFHIVPPLVFTLVAAARPRLALPVLATPALLLPAVHAAGFPLCDLVLLTALVALVASHNVACFTLFLAARLITPSALVRVATPALERHFHAVPHALVALLGLYVAHESHRGAGVATATPVPKRHARRAKRAQNAHKAPLRTNATLSTVALAVVLPACFLLSSALAPSLEAALRTLSPRPLPPSYRVLAQSRGPTGLVSVVEARNSHRMLTADLSVLGGYHRRAGYAPDSIFSQFHVHEAVRLARRRGDAADGAPDGGRNGDALCIGVGIGVVARSLRRLGCAVDAVELDGAVASYARAWFALQGPVTVADARDVLQRAAAAGARRYDYIVHDAFTGGAVSTALVAPPELRRLRAALRDDGVLAINVVAHGRAKTAAAVVYDRLARAFGHVRMFSEHARGDPDAHGLDNVVVFASPVALGVRFRKAVARDFADSAMREERLRSFEDAEIERGALGAPFGGAWAEELALRRAMWEVGWEHARLMKVVHPAGLWPALVAMETRT